MPFRPRPRSRPGLEGQRGLAAIGGIDRELRERGDQVVRVVLFVSVSRH